jgi:alpha-beta hydrolase superfamily lysophospholipase
MTPRVALLLVGAVMLPGCGNEQKTLKPLPSPIVLCDVKIRAEPITFRTEDGVRLTGVVLGGGERAIVFANPWGAEFAQGRARPISMRSSVRAGGLYCAWFATRRLADDLVRNGFQLLLFDYRGTGWSESRRGVAADRFDLDVAGAVDEVRRRGARKVVLVGASLGGIIVIATAPELDDEPTAIVALSASGFEGTNSGRGHGNLDARAAVADLDVPLLLLAAKGEREDFADAQALFAAATTNKKELEIVPGSAHATALYSDGPAAAKNRARIVEFVKVHSGD